MTDEEWAKGVYEIIAATRPGTHAPHRALDMLWTRYALEKGGIIAEATKAWMAAIEGQHTDHLPYPLPRLGWWKRPWACRFGRHQWIDNTSEYAWPGTVTLDCPLCGAHEGGSNPCP